MCTSADHTSRVAASFFTISCLSKGRAWNVAFARLRYITRLNVGQELAESLDRCSWNWTPQRRKLGDRLPL